MADAFVVDNQPERIGAKPLFELAMDKLRKNIHLLWETNDTPLHILLPLVALVQNPAQLTAIEKSSPHLQSHLGVFWLRVIKSSITGWEEMLLKNKFHSDGRPWTEAEIAQKATSRTYRNCVKRMKEEDAAAEEQLRQALGQASAAQRDKETLLIEKLPTGYMKKRKRGEGYDGTSAASQHGELRFGGGSRTKTTTARGVMTKIRREVKEARFSNRGGSLATPTHLLQEKAKFLPQGMDQRFTESNQSKKPPSIFRLIAKPISTTTTSRLSSTAPPRPVNDVASTSNKKLPIAATASNTTPSLATGTRGIVPQQSARHGDTPTKRMDGTQSTEAISPARPLGQRKRHPPTILMPARRKRP